MMKEEARKLLNDDELDAVIGGLQSEPTARCAGEGCGHRIHTISSMYKLNGKYYCPACYQAALKG